MAKKSKNSGTRGSSLTLTPSLRSRPLQTVDLSQVDPFRLADLYEPTRPARLFSGVTATVGVADQPKKKGTRSRVPSQLQFTAPAETIICVRRSRRKEVLFAKRKTGRAGQKQPRRTPWSEVKC